MNDYLPLKKAFIWGTLFGSIAFILLGVSFFVSFPLMGSVGLLDGFLEQYYDIGE